MLVPHYTTTLLLFCRMCSGFATHREGQTLECLQWVKTGIEFKEYLCSDRNTEKSLAEQSFLCLLRGKSHFVQ